MIYFILWLIFILIIIFIRLVQPVHLHVLLARILSRLVYPVFLIITSIIRMPAIHALFGCLIVILVLLGIHVLYALIPSIFRMMLLYAMLVLIHVKTVHLLQSVWLAPHHLTEYQLLIVLVNLIIMIHLASVLYVIMHVEIVKHHQLIV